MALRVNMLHVWPTFVKSVSSLCLVILRKASQLMWHHFCGTTLASPLRKWTTRHIAHGNCKSKYHCLKTLHTCEAQKHPNLPAIPERRLLNIKSPEAAAPLVCEHIAAWLGLWTQRHRSLVFSQASCSMLFFRMFPAAPLVCEHNVNLVKIFRFV